MIGGNDIPDAYLDRFNKRTKDYLARIDGRPPADAAEPEVPADLGRFLEELGAR